MTHNPPSAIAPVYGRRQRANWCFVLVAIAFFGSSLTTTSPAWARTYAPRRPAASSYEVIVAVNQSAGTVLIGHANGNNHSTKLLKIDRFTEITVDGQKAAIHDLQKGMSVDVTIGGDADVAAALAAKHVH